MILDYPLRFEPIFRRYIWGGRRLATILGKPLPPGDDFAESWEIVDHRADQSVVVAGAFAGWSLGDLVRQHGESLLGRHAPLDQFPLLFKFLDAHRNLSVQVHPNDQQAARLTPPDRGKTEAWVVIHAEPDSRIYAGLQPDVDRAVLLQHLHQGTTPAALHPFQPSIGDTLLIPAGTVHALGQGLIVAEIQQASDTTFRLFDWNRAGPDGRPRPLHVDEGLRVIDFERGPVEPINPRPGPHTHVQKLVTCDKFIMDRWTVSEPQLLGDDASCHLVAAIAGAINVDRDPMGQPLSLGETMLLPAGAGPVEVSPSGGPAILLDIYLG